MVTIIGFKFNFTASSISNDFRTLNIAESYRKSHGRIVSNEENRYTNDLVMEVGEQFNGHNFSERRMKRVKRYG